MKIWILPFVIALQLSCVNQEDRKPDITSINSVSDNYKIDSLTKTGESTIYSKFPPPSGYECDKTDERYFQYFIQNLPLKPVNTYVTLYNGQEKSNQSAHSAVVDLPIGNKNLHQCADAIIRLRADYFYQKQAYDSIQFHFTNGFLADYGRWRSGDGIKVIGNDVSWIEGYNTDTSHDHYWQYLEKVFMYAGTLSLDKELKPKKWEDLSIGDVLIQGGSPGHAVIVVNVAVNNAGEKVFMLAQSYMPAQELHILKNPNDHKLSPWYHSKFNGDLHTPEWTFKKSDLKSF